METQQMQPAARYLGTCRNIPIYRFPPVFRLCIHNTLSTVIPASGMRHTDGTQKTLPSFSPSPTRCLLCLPTKGTYTQAQPALQLTQISPAQTKDLQTTHHQPARHCRAAPQEPISPGQQQPAHACSTHLLPLSQTKLLSQQKTIRSLAQRWVW